MSTDYGEKPILEAEQMNKFSINNVKYPLLINVKL